MDPAGHEQTAFTSHKVDLQMDMWSVCAPFCRHESTEAYTYFPRMSCFSYYGTGPDDLIHLFPSAKILLTLYDSV